MTSTSIVIFIRIYTVIFFTWLLVIPQQKTFFTLYNRNSRTPQLGLGLAFVVDNIRLSYAKMLICPAFLFTHLSKLTWKSMSIELLLSSSLLVTWVYFCYCFSLKQFWKCLKIYWWSEGGKRVENDTPGFSINTVGNW